MLSNKKIKCPINLLKLAKMAIPVKAAIVSAGNKLAMISAKEASKKSLIEPIFIGDKKKIEEEAKLINWNISKFEIIHETKNENNAIIGASLASKGKAEILVKGNIHTDILMKTILKKEFNLITTKRLSHLWHMTVESKGRPLFITDGALNVSPRIEVKMHILRNVIEFANKLGITRPKVAILSGTEDPIKSLPSSMDALEIMKRSKEENLKADVFGPLAFDNSVSIKAAKIKNIKNSVAGNADILLVPNLETGNSLTKMMVYFMSACAAGIVVGGKVPIVVTSRADDMESRLASIAAAVIASKK